MRLATTGDEIPAAREVRLLVTPPFLPVFLLTRVVTRPGTISPVAPHVIESLVSSDHAYLRQLYARMNDYDPGSASITCPHCRRSFVPEKRPTP